MRATVQQQRALLGVADFDGQLARVGHALEQLEKDATLADLHTELTRTSDNLLAASGERDDVSAELARAENDVALVDARLTRNSERATQSGNAKDAQALESESQALRERKNMLEDMQLAVMERLEAGEAAVADAQSARDAVEQRIAEQEQRQARARTELDAERDQLAAEREAAAAGLDASLLELYERQRQRYGIGAALLQRGVSLGSNVALPPTELDEIRRAPTDEVVLDPEGGCILIRDENSWP